jgi:hypothetical protein
MSKRQKTQFQATIGSLKHLRPQTPGTPPGTSVTLDTSALDVEVAAKLFEMADGHIVNVTIERAQDKLPLEDQPPLGEEPADAEARLGALAKEGRTDVPRAFQEA